MALTKKDCLSKALERLLGKLNLTECIEATADALAAALPLKLPYRSRGGRLESVFMRRVVTVERCGLKALLFLVEGLRRTYVLCLSNSITVGFEEESRVSDELSGLRMKLRKPVIMIGSCRIPFRWKGSVMVLDAGDVEKCEYCEKIVC